MRAALVLLLAALAAAPAMAAEKLDGYFVALETCEAFQSKNKQTNPGGVRTEPMRAYEMIAINKAGGDYFQVRVDGAPVTQERWVHVSCGVHVVAAGTPVDPGVVNPPVVVTPPEGEEATENLLALSWQPAFCEMRPGKAECVSLNDGLLPHAEAGLSLHGLWPQPRGNDYCGVPAALVSLDKASRWSELPEVEMDDESREALAVAMPGTVSFLERHEWIKHGVCYKDAGGADAYVDDMLFLLDAINGSAVGAFLAAHVGAEVRGQEIRDRFDEAFGPGAGARVSVQCKGDGGRTLVQELRINLRGEISPDAEISSLLLAADETSLGCARGVIDPAGLQ